jgi:arabinan endo-1,5-alpha-L-arabinosidase
MNAFLRQAGTSAELLAREVASLRKATELVMVLLGCLGASLIYSATYGAEEPASLAAERVHDPSTIVDHAGAYWLFSTGPGISSHSSTDLVTWVKGPAVFQQAPTWTSNAVPGFKGYFWAPDVALLRGRFHVYYSVSTWGKQVSAIGLVTNSTLDPNRNDYRWQDEGPVITSCEGDPFNAIDPGVFVDADERVYLVFGSFWKGIFMVELNAATGKRLAADSPPTPLAWHTQIEAPFLYRHAGHYYLFVNHGACCRGTNSTYQIRVGRSEAIAGPYVDAQERSLLNGGGTLVLESRGEWIGPGHAGIYREETREWLSFHYYDGSDSGRPKLGVRPLTWTPEGWPHVEFEESPR